MRTGAVTRLAAALCLAAGGCLADPLMELGATDPYLEDCATTAFLTEEYRRPQPLVVDFLVVMDNSLSMEDEQANLAENFPDLIRDLLDPPVDPETGYPIHLPLQDMHIGVISTDMGTGGYSVGTCSDPIDGDDGVLQHEPPYAVAGCGDPLPTFLEYAYMSPHTEEAERMAHEFGCLARLGTDGCGFEQHLKAMARSFEHMEGGPNAGFLREDSLLAVLFVTDEEDCSVVEGGEGIFDYTDTAYGHLSLRCFLHPDMIEPVETYIDILRSIKDDPDRLVVSFIVGVPQTEMCEGTGDAIPECLDHPDMIERVDPTALTQLVPACTTTTGAAFPGRRFVEISQALGDNAMVHSICNDDFGPALDVLTWRLHDRLDSYRIPPELPFERDPEDDCRCQTTCTMIELLENDLPCPASKPCVRSDGPTNGCLTSWSGEVFRSLCTIPQAGTRTSLCGVACDDPGAVHAPDPSSGGGWFYLGNGWSFESGTGLATGIGFTEGMEPDAESLTFLSCEACLGPPLLGRTSGGHVGTRCSPETCPQAYDDLGEPIEGECGWDTQWRYIAEAEECGGGACLAFRVSEGLWEPYCSRRCGRSGGGACPDGFACYPALPTVGGSPGCYCVDRDQLLLDEGSWDQEGIRTCR